MSGQGLLPECFIYGHGAGDRDVQRSNDANLRYDKITICHRPDVFTHPLMLVTKYQGYRLNKVNLM
jgi:hypothetical protein